MLLVTFHVEIGEPAADFQVLQVRVGSFGSCHDTATAATIENTRKGSNLVGHLN